MICCEDGEEYIPHGRLVMQRHPCREKRRAGNKEWWTIVEHNGLEEELYINNRTVVWSKGQAGTAQVEMGDVQDSSTGRRCGSDSSRSVVCTLTMETPIKQVLFTTFYTYPDQPAMLGEQVDNHPTGMPLYSLCVLEQEYLTVYTEAGEEFNIALPFAVEKAWSIWYGLLLQRKLNSVEHDPPNPLLFSLLHPLEEINPINEKRGSSNAALPCYGTDIQQSVIMTAHHPSLTLTYSAKHNSVSVWRARRCSMEENAAMVHNCSFTDCKFGASFFNATNPHNQSFCMKPPPNFHSPIVDPLRFTPSHANNHTTLNFTPSGNTNQQHTVLNFTPNHFTPSQLTPAAIMNFTPTVPLHNQSLYNSYHSTQSYLASPAGAVTPVAGRRSPGVAMLKTPANVRLRTMSMLACSEKHTPKQQPQPSQGALFARTPSPSSISHHMRLGLISSPLCTPRSTIPRTPAHSFLNESVGDVEPLIPDLCLELLWTDQTATKPKKTFLSEDCVGQRFLCFVLKDTIRLIKYEHTNDMSSLVFGSCSTISGQDAVPLHGLRMMLIIDDTGSLALYSGLMLICKIHVTQTSQALNTTLFKDFSSLNISSQMFSSGMTPMRRSTLIATNGRPPSALGNKFDMTLSPVVSDKQDPAKAFSGVQMTLSPVVSDKQDPAKAFSLDELPAAPAPVSVKGLQDPTMHRVTIEQSNGVRHRITMPDMWSSSLVGRVLAAFKYILPRDSAMQFIAKWYSTRNSPGAGDFSAHGEWFLFSRTLLTMIGYDTDKLQATCPLEPPGSSGAAALQKKVKTTENGSEKDWDYIISSQYHRETDSDLNEVLHLGWLGSLSEDYTDIISNFGLNISAPLFQHLPAIFYSLHLLYEELKCCMLYWDLCALLVPCLSQLAADLRSSTYLHHYWKDFPTICSPDGPLIHLSDQNLTKLSKPGYFSDAPPNFLATLLTVMKGEKFEPFPYIPEVCPFIRSVLLIYCVAANDCSLNNVPLGKFLRRVSPSGQKAPEPVRPVSMNAMQDEPCIHEKIVLLTDGLSLTNLDVQLLAPGLSLLLMNSQHRCRINPPLGWNGSTYQLINRPDMVKHSHHAALYSQKLYQVSQDASSAPVQSDGFKCPVGNIFAQNNENEENNKTDGMDSLDWTILRLRWPTDKRMRDVRQMLNSASPVHIDIKQRPEVSDHDFLEEQERYLFSLCIRTMALPLGRGMLTLSTHTPVITETLGIPPLTLTGKAAPRGTTVDLSSIEVPANMNLWPLFHNGVACGLKVHPSSEDIDTSWILYNRPKLGNDAIVEHAGFLMGLGLSGHIRHLSTVGIHEYLSRTHELTSVGLLLGLAIARRGTCHAATTKLLSIHLECLLPPTCTELDIHHIVQVASIMSIGLLYQGSGHRHMAEVLLREIGRPPGPEMENSNDRESYSLAAGLGLGLIMFGKGVEPEQFSDLDIAGQLYHYIEGGYQKPMTGPTRDKYRSPSYQIKEGKRVNIDVTSPGATLALGMIFFGSNNKAIAQWMVAPRTIHQLEQIRPDFLLLRTVSRGLIMWSEVVPSMKWVESNMPHMVLKNINSFEETNVEEPNVDYETMYQAFFNLIAGSCFVLGLKFAGSANDDAFQIIYKYTTMLFRYSKNTNISVVAGKCCIESCLCVSMLSLALVMAGTGDLEVLRLIRFLRDRVGPLNTSVGYGSHVALHMALGFLFLGGGRFTLNTEPLSVAALLIACFPKMPQHSGDNRYHLQAFRHLYVLACEPRLLVPVDTDSGALCRANVRLKFTAHYGSVSYATMAPVMLPELSCLQEVTLETSQQAHRYWPARFTRDSNWAILESLLKGGYGVTVKLREGEAPYPAVLPPADGEAALEGDDGRGGDTVTQPEQPPPWIAQSAQLVGIGGDRAAQLVKVLLGVDISPASDLRQVLSDGTADEADEGHQESQCPSDRALYQLLAAVVNDHLSMGKPEAIANWLSVIQGIKKISQLSQNCGLLVWQVKMIHGVANFLSLLSSRDRKRGGGGGGGGPNPPKGNSCHRVQRSLLLRPTVGTADGAEQTSVAATGDGTTRPTFTISDATMLENTADSPSTVSAQLYSSLNTADNYSKNNESTSMPSLETSFDPQLPMDVSNEDFAEAMEESSHLESIPRQLVAPDQAISIRCRLVKLVDSWNEEVGPELVHYLKQDPQPRPPYSPKTALTLLLLDVPHPSALGSKDSASRGALSRLQLARELHRLGVQPAVIQAVLPASAR